MQSDSVLESILSNAITFSYQRGGISIHFRDMSYERITYETLEERYQALIQAMREADNAEGCLEVMRRRAKLGEDMTPMDLCYIRHDMDVNDPFYAAEQSYYDEINPKLAVLSNELDRLILDSPFRPEIEEMVGSLTLTLMEESQLGYDSRIIPLSQAENELIARHGQLLSNAAVHWEGKEIPRGLMTVYTQSSDRETRRLANEAVTDSWEAQRPELEEIYDKLVHNRAEQAKTLGFSNFVELSYHRMNRIGYGPEEVRCFREQVKRHLKPLLAQMEQRRRQRLGLEHLYYYDGICFLNGNPTPMGDTEQCLAATREMYTRISPETADFIGYLLDNGLYDVEIRTGKRTGGYMMHLEKYRAPFIFANFDGTSENAYIMCHEGGHAFQDYLKRGEEIRDRCHYTSETAETHAMAMEFFAWPHMELFFGERAEDYRTMHLENALRLIARECLQDEFEQRVYECPDMSPKERNDLWLRLSREYLPGSDCAGNTHLEEGCSWQHIPHVFLWPFYAIDYALAQVCALEYCRWMQQDKDAAWQSYLTFCRKTGSMDFPHLVKAAGLDDPFAEGTLCSLIGWLQDQI